ncbi:MAG: dTDP-4-dehydrorhamnose 3,5-epimerase family protein [Thermodesulfobacteriota bacterium]
MFTDGDIDGVKVRRLARHQDGRGWLMEIFRTDELAGEFHPAMSYISLTRPGVGRGPHEHADQADYFCFAGPSDFMVRLWDNREGSPTFGRRMEIKAGESDPMAILVPAGVVHGYRNVGDVDGLVINCPNRLFKGEGRKGPVDEIRHEGREDSPFRMD